MLVLSRNIGQRIVLTVPPSSAPTRIEVQVVGANDFRAWLGTECPRDVEINREEVQNMIDAGTPRGGAE